MNKFKIIGKTNGWIANRDIQFKGKTTITIEDNLSLKEAQSKLLEMFNNKYDKCYKHWGMATRNNDLAFSHKDGTRGFEYDSRYFIIEEQ